MHPPGNGNQARMSADITLIQIAPEAVKNATKRKRGVHIGREVARSPLFDFDIAVSVKILST